MLRVSSPQCGYDHRRIDCDQRAEIPKTSASRFSLYQAMGSETPGASVLPVSTQSPSGVISYSGPSIGTSNWSFPSTRVISRLEPGCNRNESRNSFGITILPNLSILTITLPFYQLIWQLAAIQLFSAKYFCLLANRSHQTNHQAGQLPRLPESLAARDTCRIS